jgi:DnaJ like chaperone protein
LSYCGECGSVITDNYNFCGNCGVKIVKNEIDYYAEVLNNFDGILIAIVAKLSKIDGRICQAESEYISELFNSLIETFKHKIYIPNIREIYKKILNNEKNDFYNLDILCKKLNQLNILEKDKIFIIEVLLELAHIDSSYDEDEENFIVKIVHYLDLDFKIYQNMKNEYSKSEENPTKPFNGTLSIKEAFEVLESNETDTNKVIKDNYRRLAKQYHYDSIVSKDLPKDLIDFAEEKLKIINSAYEKVKKYKGI